MIFTLKICHVPTQVFFNKCVEEMNVLSRLNLHANWFSDTWLWSCATSFWTYKVENLDDKGSGKPEVTVVWNGYVNGCSQLRPGVSSGLCDRIIDHMNARSRSEVCWLVRSRREKCFWGFSDSFVFKSFKLLLVSLALNIWFCFFCLMHTLNCCIRDLCAWKFLSET